jgi:hypothetical protein
MRYPNLRHHSLSSESVFSSDGLNGVEWLIVNPWPVTQTRYRPEYARQRPRARTILSPASNALFERTSACSVNSAIKDLMSLPHTRIRNSTETLLTSTSNGPKCLFSSRLKRCARHFCDRLSSGMSSSVLKTLLAVEQV